MYTKLIISGNMAEYYQYEKQRNEYVRKGVSVLPSVGVYGRETDDTQRMGRRRDSASRAKVAFGRLCSANFGTDTIAVFVTLSFSKEQTIESGYKLFALFTKRLRTRYGSDIRYLAVPEFGNRNTKRLHFHALFFGLPVESLKRERETRDFAKVWGYGFVDVVVTNNDSKIGFYLAKYLSKAYKDPRLLNHCSYVASRNIRRPVVHVDYSSLYFSYLIQGVDNSLVRSVVYDTIWLGQCKYEQYILH